jgi:hypothetical protein
MVIETLLVGATYVSPLQSSEFSKRRPYTPANPRSKGVQPYALTLPPPHPDPPRGRGEKEREGAFCYLGFGRRNFSRIHPLTQSPWANTQYF